MDDSRQAVGFDPGDVLPSYELMLAYYETVGTVGLRCRYHEHEAYVQRCHADASDFLPPSTLTLATDGAVRFRIVCHDPRPQTAGDAHTYTWEVHPIGDAPETWPSSGQFTCTDDT